MERPSRALRRLPGRLSDVEAYTTTGSSKSPGRKKSVSPRKGVSPSRKANKEIKSPPRRSRSRSTGRKKLVANKIEEKKSASPARNTKSKTKSVTPPSSGIISRVTDSVEKFTKSLSPEIETYVRSSISRFEEVTNDVVRRSITPRPGLSVSTRSSLRLKSSSNNIESLQKVEYSEEKVVKNHVGKTDESKSDSEEGRLRILNSVLNLLLISLLIATTIIAHTICSRDDCRLGKPDIQKLLNYKLYSDPYYLWLVFTASFIVLFAAARFVQVQIKRAPYISLLGIGWLLIAVGSLGACHFYFSGLQLLKIVPFISATLLHVFIFTALSANSNSLLGVKIPSFIYRLSGLISVIVGCWIAAAESNRTVPSLTVYILAGFLAWNGADSLIFEPILNRTTPLCILHLVIRPLILALIPIYLSANGVKPHVGLQVVFVAVYLLGYLLYRWSLFKKGRFLSDPYSYRNMKVGSTDYSEGPWQVVRHPDLLGRLIAELGLAASLAPNPTSLGIAALVLTSTLLEAWHLDRHTDLPSRSARKSLIPFVY